jgi:hypothetical protein
MMCEEPVDRSLDDPGQDLVGVEPMRREEVLQRERVSELSLLLPREVPRP